MWRMREINRHTILYTLTDNKFAAWSSNPLYSSGEEKYVLVLLISNLCMSGVYSCKEE